MNNEELPNGYYIDDACDEAEGIESYQACHDGGWCGPVRECYQDAIDDAIAHHAKACR